MTLPSSLAPEQLRQPCALAGPAFGSTCELPDFSGMPGQDRAEQALLFGLEMAHPGYHIFVMGEPGTGRHAHVMRLVRHLAATRPVPPDLAYVHHFADPRLPHLLVLPAGRGMPLRLALQRFSQELLPAVSAALEARAHLNRVELLQEANQLREEQAIQELAQACESEGLMLLSTAEGWVITPSQAGEPLSAEAFAALPGPEQNAYELRVAHWRRTLQALLADFPGWRYALALAIQKAEREVLEPVLQHLTTPLRTLAADLPDVIAFLDALCEDVIVCLRQPPGDGEAETEGSSSGLAGLAARLDLQRYQLNLLVDHGSTTGAPVVCEDNPGLTSLLGRIEYRGGLGNGGTDFSLIRPGALHRASGGYLVVDAGRLMAQPYAWEALKRTLRSARVAMEAPAEAQEWHVQASLTPQPVPVQLKVILIGERDLFYGLMEGDPDFPELFKIAADFEDDLPRTPDTEQQFAHLLATLGRRSGLLPFDYGAVTRLIEEAARHAEHARRLSLHTRYLVDLMREADFCARAAVPARAVVCAADLEMALQARMRRADRYPRHVLASTLEGSTLIATQGERAGQINALVVVELAGICYGHPVRVTATARVGNGDVVDIERETELGGAIHSKGVLIISAFLAARFARHQPLSLAASLVFEQSYGQVEGDSASLAELAALLSALAQVPIRQNLAVTGSVNQFGEIQVVGGVNEKIEGFFDLCQARGLTGTQGVLIPAASVVHLMLRPDLVEATRAGLFHVWPVATIDDAMQHLTGLEAGVPDARGQLPRGSLNERIARTLAEMTAVLHPATDPHGWKKSPRHNRFSST